MAAVVPPPGAPDVGHARVHLDGVDAASAKRLRQAGMIGVVLAVLSAIISLVLHEAFGVLTLFSLIFMGIVPFWARQRAKAAGYGELIGLSACSCCCSCTALVSAVCLSAAGAAVTTVISVAPLACTASQSGLEYVLKNHANLTDNSLQDLIQTVQQDLETNHPGFGKQWRRDGSAGAASEGGASGWSRLLQANRADLLKRPIAPHNLSPDEVQEVREMVSEIRKWCEKHGFSGEQPWGGDSASKAKPSSPLDKANAILDRSSDFVGVSKILAFSALVRAVVFALIALRASQHSSIAAAKKYREDREADPGGGGREDDPGGGHGRRIVDTDPGL
jgi:hypothetical protein